MTDTTDRSTSLGDRLVTRHLATLRLISDLLERHTALQYETDQARREEGVLTEGNLADIGYFERQIENLLDHHRKESKFRHESIGDMLCRDIMRRFAEGKGELKARGKYANASADVKRVPILPKKGDPDYDEIMESMGIPAHLVRSGVLYIHYKHMGDYLTELANNNKNAPGRMASKAVPRVTYRSNTGKKVVPHDPE